MSILVLRYLEYALSKDSEEAARNNQNILNSIHPDLKFEVLQEIYVNIFQKMPILEKISHSTLAKLAQYAEELHYAPGQLIIDESDLEQDLSIFYIESGSVIIFLKDSDTYLKELNATEVFGEFAFFTGCRRFSSVKAKGYVTVVRFQRKSLIECFDKNGIEHLAMFKYKLTIYSDFSAFDIICYSCRGRNHTAKQCKYTHMEINKRNLVRSKKAETNDRKNWIRRNRRPFSAKTCQGEIWSAISKLEIERQKTRISRNF